jgi:putative chitinase
MIDRALKLTELSKEQLTALQTNLKGIGLYQSAIDGLLGPGTINAWKTFKQQNHLADPHLIGPSSYKQLESQNNNRLISREDFNRIFKYTSERDRQKYYEPINQTLKEFQINTPARIAAFLAQLAHESGSLRYSEEIASGAAYEGRKDLGNVKVGDGKRYKGRGLIQVTGRHNYTKYGKILGLPLAENPKLAENPTNSARIAGAYWQACGLNKLADKNTLESFKLISRRINGGYNGLSDRINYWNLAKSILT